MCEGSETFFRLGGNASVLVVHFGVGVCAGGGDNGGVFA
jgi:hypothetical protein